MSNSPASPAITAATNDQILIDSNRLIGERVVNKACSGFAGANINNKCAEILASGGDFMPNIVGDISR